MGFINKRTGRSLQKDLYQLANDFIHIVKAEAPLEAEAKLEELAKKSFEKEQLQDGTAQSKWKPRKNEKSNARSKRRGLLIKTGDGRRSVETSSGNGKASIGTDLIYMEVHNEGKKAGRGKGFTMPKRSFMTAPESENKALSKHMETFLNEKMDEANK